LTFVISSDSVLGNFHELKKLYCYREMREYPDLPLMGVCAAVIKNDKILLVKRGIPPSMGLWVMPGGSVKLGESLKQVAERETTEETGITVKAIDDICTLDFIERDIENRIKFHFIIAYIQCEYVDGMAKGNSDALEARWFGKGELNGVSITNNTKHVLEKLRFIY
jgi:8-oxo-dGTP diphosphatase